MNETTQTDSLHFKFIQDVYNALQKILLGPLCGSKREFCSRLWNRRCSRSRRRARLFGSRTSYEDDDEHDVPEYQGPDPLLRPG